MKVLKTFLDKKFTKELLIGFPTALKNVFFSNLRKSPFLVKLTSRILFTTLYIAVYNSQKHTFHAASNEYIRRGMKQQK